MKKRIIIALFAGIAILFTGCAPGAYPETVLSNEAVQSEADVQENIEDDDLKGASDEAEEASDSDENAASEEEISEEAGEEAEESEDDMEYYEDEIAECGVRIKLPVSLENMLGIFNYSGYELDPGIGIYEAGFAYMGITPEWLDEVDEKDEPSDEDYEHYYDSIVPLDSILCISEGRGVSELAEVLNDEFGADCEESQFTELGKSGEYTFFRYTPEEEPENIDNLENEFREEYEAFLPKFDKIIAEAEFFEPEGAYDDIIGKKVSFETTDIDGNPITSEEIFSAHEITMVNVWATWCHWCLVELPELEEINGRLEKMDCAIVGLLGDGTDKETIKEGKQILKENGVTYLNILPWDGALEDDFNMDEGWPTSFFVDREGRIVSLPVVGADTDAYEK